MTKAIFTHKANSIYDDLPEERYHFPEIYLRQVESTVGDFIVYYEPGRTGTSDRGRTGRLAYIATAQVTGIDPDPLQAGHFYARIDPESYIVFDRPVPFRKRNHYYERQLQRDDGGTSKGAFGRAVRSLSEGEYEEILRAGFARELDQPPAVEDCLGTIPDRFVLREEAATFERPLVDRVLSRPVRDAAFARAVQEAYGATCAMTGLKIINGGGRAEVEAVHIRPVHDRGPDSIRNGLALSRTVHWMFDRGLISIGAPPNYQILVSERGRLPQDVLRFFNLDGTLRLPKDQRLWPAKAYLEYHRDVVFKGWR